MTAVVVLALGVAGLALAALLLRGERDRRVRLLSLGGMAAGFVAGLLLTLAFGRGLPAALATASLGAAVLALMLIGQWRAVRGLLRRAGMKI